MLGGLAALSLGLAGCGGATYSSPGSLNISFKVFGSTIIPPNPGAVKGEMVTFTITTDKDEEVHLHGYDIHFDCKANQPLTRTFTADKAGQFELELEATHTQLTSLTVKPN